LQENAKVSELINKDTRGQVESAFNKTIFWEEEVEVISQIPLSMYDQYDVLIWRGSITCEFTVRSASHMEKDRQEEMGGKGSTASTMHIFWKTIWGLKVPNTVKNFLLQADLQ
jgi:hypothetical protein